RYPLPENIGLELEVDRGNVVKMVNQTSPSAKAGLRQGDVVKQLNGVPIHSMADVQFALDRSPKAGATEIAWQRGEQEMTQQLALANGWRKSDLTWRPSMQERLAAARLYGVDLTDDQKKALGLAPQRLAFRQNESVSAQARAAGIRTGDIIVGI